jgi:hypothetical protein
MQGPTAALAVERDSGKMTSIQVHDELAVSKLVRAEGAVT